MRLDEAIDLVADRRGHACEIEQPVARDVGERLDGQPGQREHRDDRLHVDARRLPQASPSVQSQLEATRSARRRG